MKTLLSLALGLFVIGTAEAQAQQQQQQQYQQRCQTEDSVPDTYPSIMYDLDGNYLQGSQAISYCRELYPEPVRLKTSTLHDLAPTVGEVKTYFIVNNQTISTGKKRKNGTLIRIGCGRVVRPGPVDYFPLESGEAAVVGYYYDAVRVICQ